MGIYWCAGHSLSCNTPQLTSSLHGISVQVHVPNGAPQKLSSVFYHMMCHDRIPTGCSFFNPLSLHIRYRIVFPPLFIVILCVACLSGYLEREKFLEGRFHIQCKEIWFSNQVVTTCLKRSVLSITIEGSLQKILHMRKGTHLRIWERILF